MKSKEGKRTLNTKLLPPEQENSNKTVKESASKKENKKKDSAHQSSVVTGICTFPEAPTVNRRNLVARWQELQHEQFANIIRAEVRRRLAAEGRTFFRVTPLLSARDEIALSRNCTPGARTRSDVRGFICVVFRREKQLPQHQKSEGRRGGSGEPWPRGARDKPARLSIETRLFKNLA